MKNIQQKLYDAIETDTDYTTKQNDTVKNVYNSCTLNEQDKVDAIFTALCGYSLDTLINRGEDYEEN